VGSSATWGLLTATFTASFVEFVEALTIVLAMGMTRSWRSALAGTGLAVVALAGFTAVAGYALVNWLPRSALQLGIGTLLLIFGLQWLRKAILRASGLKALNDEAAEFREQEEAARLAGDERRFGLDWFSFVISFKGVFLEGVEVVFIVITFGLNAHNVPLAAGGAAAAGAIVLGLGAVVHRPLTRVPENTLKYVVGLMLATFGTFWAVEGLGVVQHGGESLTWPGDNWSLLALLAGWFLLTRLLIRAMPWLAGGARGASIGPSRVGEGRA
jgi:Ca2+/H+ antiporter, TMEM165/GDT1 family